MKHQRNQTIDCLRFIFAVIIVIHHSRSLLGDENCMFLGGSLAVEFFFLVSGYLMMASVFKKNQSGKSTGTAKETLGFLKRKLYSFYPEVLVAWIVAFAFTCWALESNSKAIIKRFVDSFSESLLLYSFGVSWNTVNPATWYLSSMLICMAILYPLLRKFPCVMKYLVMPLSALFLLGWLCKNDGHPRNPTKWIGFTYKGNLRALAELELGVLLFFSAQKIRKIPFNRLGKTLLTIIECCCYAAVVIYMFLETPSRRDLFFIGLLCLGISLSFSKQTLLSELPESKFVFWLGKFSFPLYLSHQFYAKGLNDLLPAVYTNAQRMVIYLFCSFATALFVWGFSNLIRRFSKQIMTTFKHLFLQESALTC